MPRELASIRYVELEFRWKIGPYIIVRGLDYIERPERAELASCVALLLLACLLTCKRVGLLEKDEM
jgi:hypothetical protein